MTPSEVVSRTGQPLTPQDLALLRSLLLAQKFNPYHDELGRFTSALHGGAGLLPAPFVREGTATRYAVRVEGRLVGRIERKRSRNPMVGGPRTYTTTWHAKRGGGYEQARAFDTQEAAEAYVLDPLKPVAPRRGTPERIAARRQARQHSAIRAATNPPAATAEMVQVSPLLPPCHVYVEDQSVDDVIAAHQSALNAIAKDPDIATVLTKANISFVLTDGSVTSVPTHYKYRGITPRGWPPGMTWDDVAGVFDTTRMEVIAGNPQLSGRSLGSVLAHETGHALTEAMESLTEEPWLERLMEPWQQMLGSTEDMTRIPQYFRQTTQSRDTKHTAGLEETFAESYAIWAHHGPEKVANKFGVAWMEAFLRAMHDVKRVGQQLRKGSHHVSL